MIFSFPGSSSRSGTSGADAGAITAVANSYSTSKGGVASSVATAYGGPPEGYHLNLQTLNFAEFANLILTELIKFFRVKRRRKTTS